MFWFLCIPVELVNKATLLHQLFLIYLFSVYLSISTCFGRLCAHHQDKQLCLCDTWYLLFCVDDWYAGEFHPAYQTVIHIVARNKQRLKINILRINILRGTAVGQWLRCYATNRNVAGSIPVGVSGFFIDIKSFRSHYGPGVDSASNRKEYQEYFLGVKAAGALGWQRTTILCRCHEIWEK